MYPLGQPTVPAGSDCRLILKFWDGRTNTIWWTASQIMMTYYTLYPNLNRIDVNQSITLSGTLKLEKLKLTLAFPNLIEQKLQMIDKIFLMHLKLQYIIYTYSKYTWKIVY